MSELGWQAHTVRGALSRLRTDWGYTIERKKVGNKETGLQTSYKIAS
jgi:hypothetical protein